MDKPPTSFRQLKDDECYILATFLRRNWDVFLTHVSRYTLPNADVPDRAERMLETLTLNAADVDAQIVCLLRCKESQEPNLHHVGSTSHDRKKHSYEGREACPCCDSAQGEKDAGANRS